MEFVSNNDNYEDNEASARTRITRGRREKESLIPARDSQLTSPRRLYVTNKATKQHFQVEIQKQTCVSIHIPIYRENKPGQSTNFISLTVLLFIFGT